MLSLPSPAGNSQLSRQGCFWPLLYFQLSVPVARRVCSRAVLFCFSLGFFFAWIFPFSNKKRQCQYRLALKWWEFLNSTAFRFIVFCQELYCQVCCPRDEEPDPAMAYAGISKEEFRCHHRYYFSIKAVWAKGDSGFRYQVFPTNYHWNVLEALKKEACNHYKAHLSHLGTFLFHWNEFRGKMHTS